MDKTRLMDIAILLVRVTVGVIMLTHGMQKLFGVFGGPGVKGFAGALGNMGFSATLFLAWAVALIETLGGICLIAGIFPRAAAALIAAVMAVAIIKVHGSNGLFASNGGFEYPLLIFAVCISILLTGGGKFSAYNRF